MTQLQFFFCAPGICTLQCINKQLIVVKYFNPTFFNLKSKR